VWAEDFQSFNYPVESNYVPQVCGSKGLSSDGAVHTLVYIHPFFYARLTKKMALFASEGFPYNMLAAIKKKNN